MASASDDETMRLWSVAHDVGEGVGGGGCGVGGGACATATATTDEEEEKEEAEARRCLHTFCHRDPVMSCAFSRPRWHTEDSEWVLGRPCAYVGGGGRCR